MELKGKHALIVGGSSGIGLATLKKLAAHGADVSIIHRDRRQAMSTLESTMDQLRAEYNVRIANFNVDATNPEKVQDTLSAIQAGDVSNIDVFLHAVSRGNLKPFVSDKAKLNAQDLSLTIDAMGTNLNLWVTSLLERKLIGSGTRILTLTSEGNNKFWEGYGAVALAKSTLETLAKYLAVELAPQGITVNIIQAGVTDTPSLRLIPESEKLLIETKERNPSGRITTSEDVANTIYLLALPEARWINGALIHVDGGEHLM